MYLILYILAKKSAWETRLCLMILLGQLTLFQFCFVWNACHEDSIKAGLADGADAPGDDAALLLASSLFMSKGYGARP